MHSSAHHTFAVAFGALIQAHTQLGLALKASQELGSVKLSDPLPTHAMAIFAGLSKARHEVERLLDEEAQATAAADGCRAATLGVPPTMVHPSCVCAKGMPPDLDASTVFAMKDAHPLTKGPEDYISRPSPSPKMMAKVEAMLDEALRDVGSNKAYSEVRPVDFRDSIIRTLNFIRGIGEQDRCEDTAEISPPAEAQPSEGFLLGIGWQEGKHGLHLDTDDIPAGFEVRTTRDQITIRRQD